jgi:hypothetical protein
LPEAAWRILALLLSINMFRGTEANNGRWPDSLENHSICQWNVHDICGSAISGRTTIA